jgi:phosphoribosyl-AMP cyclohydrolase
MSNWLDEVKWDAQGLVTAIAQDSATGRVLMVAWMNRESLQLTADTGIAHYWSRSRQKLWKKGEESGHLQTVHELRLDCDGDVIVMQIRRPVALPAIPAAKAASTAVLKTVAGP